MENELENADSQIAEENVEVTDDTPTLEDYNRVVQEKAELEAKNKQLYARVKTAKPSEPLTNKQESMPDLSEVEKRIEKKLELKSQGFTEEDIVFINANGGDVNNPYVKNALDSMKSQREAEKATEIYSSSQSDIEKKFTSSELRGMSTDELEKILPRV